MQLLFLLQLFLKLENLHLHADDIIILIGNDFLEGGHVYVWFFGIIGIDSFIKIPGFYLSLHSPIFFFYIPNSGFERTIFFFDLIDDTLEIVVFIPNYVLGSHVAVEIDIRMKNIVI